MPRGTAIAKPPPRPVAGTGAQRGARDRPDPARAAWWSWPHLLSLDAPLVAVVWERWWAHSAGVRALWNHDAVLGLGVWLIYVADRLADTAPTACKAHETARHAFYRRNRRPMGIAATVILIGLAWLAPSLLPARQFVAGLGLLALVFGYFWLVHRRADGDWARVLPKEMFVAGVFAAGTAFFVIGETGFSRWELLAACVLFGGLCFLNCALITKWERNPPDLREPASLLNAFPRLTATLYEGCAGLALVAAAAAAVGPTRDNVFVPVCISALLLAVLDRNQARFSAGALRVLADAALLTPALCSFVNRP